MRKSFSAWNSRDLSVRRSLELATEIEAVEVVAAVATKGEDQTMGDSIMTMLERTMVRKLRITPRQRYQKPSNSSSRRPNLS